MFVQRGLEDTDRAVGFVFTHLNLYITTCVCSGPHIVREPGSPWGFMRKNVTQYMKYEHFQLLYCTVNDKGGAGELSDCGVTLIEISIICQLCPSHLSVGQSRRTAHPFRSVSFQR